MGTWFSNWFFRLTSNMALESAIYSCGLASQVGVYQIKEPDSLKNYYKRNFE